MAETKEAAVKRQVRKLLTEFGIYHFMPPGMGFGRAGIPDIICCYQGKFIAIECKAGKGTTTALQDRELAAIRAAGGTAWVINETGLLELKEKLQWMR
jgi:Holliday junction resolvase